MELVVAIDGKVGQLARGDELRAAATKIPRTVLLPYAAAAVEVGAKPDQESEQP